MLKLRHAPAVWTGLVGALLLAAMVVSMRGSNWPFPQDFKTDKPSDSVELAAYANGTAMRYARAVHEDNCAEAIALTLWMRERIEWAQLEHPERVGRAQEELCNSLIDRRIEGNQLSKEGIEDQYLLAPGCEFTLVGVDEGRDDLKRPTASRAWIQITFPRKESAPLDLNGLPIRRLVAGICTTSDSYVLKAAVVGNLEIDLESIDTSWNANGGNGRSH